MRGIGSMNNMNELTSMNVVNGAIGREATLSDASSNEERELFAIFSGLRVVHMTTAHGAHAPRATAFDFEGEASARQSQEVAAVERPDRPYRWLPTQFNMPPGSYHARLSSV